MITLLHGDNVEASRLALLERKRATKGVEIRPLEGRTLDRDALQQALFTTSMEASRVLVIIENLFVKLARKSKAADEFLTMIRNWGSLQDIILWESKEIDKSQLSKLGPTAKVELFKTPQVLFELLDGLRPGNKRRSLELYRQAVTHQPAEILFAMLSRRIRQLILAVSGGSVPGLAPWQSARLTSQARFFTMEKLQTMYRQLLVVEYSTKSGQSPFNLSQHVAM